MTREDRCQKAHLKINKISQYKSCWNGPDTAPFSPDSIKLAHQVANFLHCELMVRPTKKNDIILEYPYYEPDHAELIIHPDGTIDGYYVYGRNSSSYHKYNNLSELKKDRRNIPKFSFRNVPNHNLEKAKKK